MKRKLPMLWLLLYFGISQIRAQDKPFTTLQDSLKTTKAVSVLQAQEHIPRAPQTIQSPNAASLGSYGEIPVSLFTGKPEINVNLHTVSDGAVSIPIALQYDATGVRPDQHTGWVGLNFNLSTNYSIVRTIRDGPDEFNLPANSLGQLGYLFVSSSVNNGANWALPDTIRKTSEANTGGVIVDTEPDEYSFNLPGLSGKFYWGSDRTWKVQCDRPVTVEMIATANTHIYPPFTPPTSIKDGDPWASLGHYIEHLEGFIITDEAGTKYIFGGSNTDFMEYSLDFFNQGRDSWICNTWNLKSIIRISGQAINFTYERGDFVAQMYFSVYNKFARIDGGSQFSCSSWSSYLSQYGAYGGKLISPLYLKEISSDNFKVVYTSSVSNDLRYTEDIFTTFTDKKILDGYSKLDFLTFLYDCYYPVRGLYPGGCGSPALSTLLAKLKWRKLDKIQIQNGAGVTVKEFGFTYINLPTQRLMLQNVQEKSGDASKVIPPYVFTYFNGTGLSLPGYSKSHTDHWGYNNGLIINTATDFNAGGSYGNVFRNPASDTRYLQLGILGSIQYPTGGVSKFIFEPHSYAKEVKLKRWEGEDILTENRRAGGLRIKEIHNQDNSGATIIKKYYYLAAFNPASPDTSATVLSSGVLGGKAQYYFPDYKPLPDDAGITVEEEIFSTQSVLPVSENSMGSHIGYSQVIERLSTEGWTVHTFSNFENGYRDAPPSGFLQVSSTPYQPYNSHAFMRGKNLSKEHYFQNGNIASKTSSLYTLVGPVKDYSARAVKTLVTILCNTDHRVYEGTAYLIDLRKFLPITETTTIYDQEDVSAFTTNIKNNTYWPNGQVYISGQTDSRERELKTWYKYPHNYSHSSFPAMTAANVIDTPVEVLQYTGSETAPAPIRRRTVSFFPGSPYLPQKVETTLGEPGYTSTDIEFLSYDMRANLLSYQEKNGIGIKREYYGPADAGKTDLLKKQTTADGTLQAQTATYDYQPLAGVQRITDANDKSIQFEYDDFSRLSAVKNPSGSNRTTYCYNYAGQLTPCSALAPAGSIAASDLILMAATGPPLPVTLVDFQAIKATGETKAALLS